MKEETTESHFNITPEEIEENHQRFESRMQKYLDEGHDRLAAMRFVIGSGEPLIGPALDVGTGKGITAIELAGRGLRVDSVDIDPEEQRFAAMNVKYAGLQDLVTFHSQDASSLPFESRSFGCAVMVDVLHHLEDARPVLKEISRLVMPHGRFVMADFNSDGFDLVAKIHRDEGREHKVGPVSMDQAISIVVDSGMEMRARRSDFLHDVAVFSAI